MCLFEYLSDRKIYHTTVFLGVIVVIYAVVYSVVIVIAFQVCGDFDLINF